MADAIEVRQNIEDIRNVALLWHPGTGRMAPVESPLQAAGAVQNAPVRVTLEGSFPVRLPVPVVCARVYLEPDTALPALGPVAEPRTPDSRHFTRTVFALQVRIISGTPPGASRLGEARAAYVVDF